MEKSGNETVLKSLQGGGRVSKYDSCSSRSEGADKCILIYTFILNTFFLLASFLGAIYTKEVDFFENLIRIITSPAKLVTDYFALGGLGSAFFNAAVCGFLTSIILVFVRRKINATTLAAYLLVVAHCFYGLNFVNMWPAFLGVITFCLLTKSSISENIHIALFATALGPFVSEFIFRYTNPDELNTGGAQVSLWGILIALAFGISVGFILPALLPGTTKMHRGFNMYKAGLSLGLLGIFLYNFFYNTFGIKSPQNLIIENEAYYSLPYSYRAFMNTFFIVLFLLTVLLGYLLNNRSFRGYIELTRDSGYGTDFLDRYGMPVCLINIGVLGLCIIAYLNLIFILPEIFPALPKGVGFTGATVGVVFAALTFSADGQQPRNVAPIALGYTLLFLLVSALCTALGMDIPWTLSTQSYINGLAFSTGLCPISGKYGVWAGTLAGFLSAIICTATADMHGGLVLYNGGFTAGLTALLLIPIFDFYNVKMKKTKQKMR